MKNLLVIDDSVVARMLIKKSLSKLRPDWQITEAISGNEGIEKSSGKLQFDLIIIDFNMPGINGLEAAKLLIPLQSKAVQILLTANIQNAIKKQANEMNMHLVEKPITEEKFLEIIARVENVKV